MEKRNKKSATVDSIASKTFEIKSEIKKLLIFFGFLLAIIVLIHQMDVIWLHMCYAWLNMKPIKHPAKVFIY